MYGGYEEEYDNSLVMEFSEEEEKETLKLFSKPGNPSETLNKIKEWREKNSDWLDEGLSEHDRFNLKPFDKLERKVRTHEEAIEELRSLIVSEPEPDCDKCIHYHFGEDGRDITCHDCKWNYTSMYEEKE